MAVETRLRAYNALEGNILKNKKVEGIILWHIFLLQLFLIPEESSGSRDTTARIQCF